MRHLLTLFLFSLSLAATAQTFFPVEATVNLTRPSVYPEDLAQPGAVVITVRLADNGDDLPVYLQLSLRDRMGRELVSEVQPSDPIFTLSNMAPLVLTGEDLRPYLEQMAAAAGAMGGQGSGVLAEGQVSLCVQFFDGRSFSDPLTERICGSNFVELLEPPIPFLPEGVQIAPPLTALNFNWLDDNLAAGVVRYEVRIWELPDVWANNPDVVINTFPLIGPPAESAVGVRTLTWTNADAPLEEGKTYVYNIRAVDLTGQNRYRNNGFSPHRIFTWQAPPNVLDELCYVPDALSVAGGNNLSWEGQDFPDVRYTVTVRELPNLNFISLTEIEPTPTFPTRTEIGGGPQVRYDYTMPTVLDTTGRGYLVELCAVCPNTGEQNCREVRYGTPRTNPGGPDVPGTDVSEEVTNIGDGTQPGDDVAEQSPCDFLLNPTLTATAISPSEITTTWDFPNYTGTGYTLRWAPEKGRGVGPDSTSLTLETTSYTLENLLPAATYTVTVCAVCPAGPVCKTQTVITPDYDCPTPDDVLAGVTVRARPPDAVSVDWSSVLTSTHPDGWWAYVNDGSGVMVPKNNALSPDSPSGGTTPGGGGGGAPATAPDTTFTDLVSDTTYTITVCYQCTDGTAVCADFEAELSGCDGLELAPEIVGVGFDTARISWNETAEKTYTVSYVRQGDDAPPTVLDASTNHKTLSDLRPTTTYEVTICSPCGSLQICDTLTLTTTAVSCSQAGEFVYEYECGTAGEIDALDAGTRVTDLTPGDSIWAGDFLVEVGQIEGAGPAFGGYGFTEVPYLAGAKLKLEFFDVEVNENCRMVAGEMVVSSPVRELLETIDNAVSDFIDLVNDIDQFLANMQQALGVFGDIVNDLATQVDQWDQLNDVIDAATEAVTQIPFIPQDLLDDLDDAADCMKAAARQDPDAPGAEQQMADCNAAFQAALAEIQQYVNDLFDAPFRVDFAADPAQSETYGSDSLRYEAIAENYVVHTINGSEYRVPWISTSTVANRPGNQLLARRADGGDISEVTFIGTDKAEISGWNKSGALARHPGLDAGGDQRVRHVFASIPGDTTGGKPPVRLAGQLSIVTYDPVEVTVHIVPVNGAEMPFGTGDSDALQQEMNAIFHPAVVDLTVVIEPSLSAPDFSDTIQRVDLHPLSNYTPQMLDLRRLLKDQPYHNGRDYYLAVVKHMDPSTREGFMPRKRRFGFLNAAARSASDRAGFARLAAHELSHGAFHLQHTFDRFDDALEGTTDNLLDYAGGKELYRYQWENVHDPERNFTLFDEEGEGESVVGEDQFTPSISAQFAKALSDLVCKSFQSWGGGEVNTGEVLSFVIPAHSNGTWDFGGIVFYTVGQQFDLDLNIYAAPPTSSVLNNGNTVFEWSGPNNNFFRVTCSSQDAGRVIDWFTGGQEVLFRYQIDELRTLGRENDLFSHLYQLSRCAMNKLTGDERITYTNYLLDDVNVDGGQEAIIGRLFDETLDDHNRYGFGQLLESYTKYNSLFEKVDDNPNAFNAILRGLLNAFWSIKPQYKPDVFGGQGNGSEVIDLSLNLQVRTGGFTNSTISALTATQGGNGRFVFTNTVDWYYMVGESAMFSETIEVSDYEPVLPMSPLGLHIGPGHRDLGLSSGQYAGIVPASFAAGLAIRRSEQIEEQAIGLTFDVALMALGVGELNLAYRSWQAARTLKGLARLTLAVADISAGMVDVTCSLSEDSDLCKEWQKVSMYVQLGLLSVSAADQIDELVTRTVRSADNIAAVLSRIEDLLPDESARILFRADWDANADGFRDYFLMASSDDLPRHIQNYRNISDLPPHIRRNSDILTVSDELRRKGFVDDQIRRLATLENAEALRTAGRLHVSHGVDQTRATRMTDNAYVLGEEVGGSLSVITQGPGRINGNFNKLDDQLQDAIGSPLREKHGIVFTLDAGADKVRQGKTIEIENGKADLEDLTSSISYQQKYVAGGSTAVRSNLNSATNQLRGSGGEFPQFSERIAHIRTHPDCTSPERFMDYDQLVAQMRLYNEHNVNFTNISSVIIENATGVHNIPVNLIVN